MEKHKTTIWSKDFIILFCISIVTSMGFQMLNPNMAEFASSIGVSTGLLGTVIAAFSFAALLARPFSGKATDSFNNKLLLVLSLAGITVSLFFYTITYSYTVMLIIRFFHGVFFGLNSTLAMAMASRTLPEEKMGSGMGVFSLGMVASMTIAPSLGIYIVDSFGYNWLFYISMMSVGFATLIALLIRNQERPAKNGQTEKVSFLMSFFAPEALNPSLIAMLNACAFGVVNTFLVIHAKGIGVEGIGLYFTVNALTLLLFRLVLAKFIDKIPVSAVIYPCSLCMIAAMVLIAVSHSLTGFLIAAVLYGIGNGGSQPALQTLCLKCVGPERRGASSGTYYMGLDTGNVIGPALGGMFAAVAGYSGAFTLMIVPIVLGMGVMFVGDRMQARKAAQAGADKAII